MVWYISGKIIDYTVFSDSCGFSNLAARGVFGDKFGAIGALFTGLAFWGALWQLDLQRRELKSQQMEIEGQRKSVDLQRFESSFFQILEIQTRVIDHLEFKEWKSHDALVYFLSLIESESPDLLAFRCLNYFEAKQIDELRQSVDLDDDNQYVGLAKSDISTLKEALKRDITIIDRYKSDDLKLHREIVSFAYIRATQKTDNSISHYFRNIYHLIKFLDESEGISDQQRNRYTGILRSQLSNTELACIFYNCIVSTNDASKAGFEFGYPKLTQLVNKYNLVHNIMANSILHVTHKLLLTQPQSE